MWKFLYSTLVLPALWLAFRALWPFNRKVRRGLRGRRSSMQRLRVFIRNNPGRRRLWVHASSMGEFEQAKPIIEELRRRMPDLVVVATFFSPSGYENNLRYRAVDAVAYIPFDTTANARRFLALLEPTAAVFIRYDVWPNHVWACHAMGIPVMLANATMRDGSGRLLPGVRRLHRAIYNAMDIILTVSEQDAENFRRLGLSRPRIAAVGDTRYDRVAGKAAESRQRMPLPAAVREGRRTLVVGSSWPEDEEIVLPVLFKLLAHDPTLQCILVPHEPTIDHLEFLEYRLNGMFASIRFSYLHAWKGERIIIVDSIGILLPLYAAADFAFVGGGFKSNVHNTLEPAAYGIPVLYGPKIANSQEARQLAADGGGIVVRNRQECYRSMRRLIDDASHRAECGRRAGAFVHARAGSTTAILEALMPLLRSE
ncbi:MAG: glycosyltransferase N-terminal domain-containing protein [Bacteroidota bacterium]|nr:glycosyltransferase N-terminal domain-containing protein [Bacteroidota bacterium]